MQPVFNNWGDGFISIQSQAKPMKYKREFEIAYLGLKEGISQYEYEIDNNFFSRLGFEHPDFETIEAVVKLNFDKRSGFFLLHFDIDGKINVACDRCGDFFDLKLWDEFDLVLKLTNDAVPEKSGTNDEDDVVFIPRSETVIDISEWIYEFILLSIPMQRVHPAKDDGSEGCNPEALKMLRQMSDEHTEQTNNIWKDLDAFKKN